MNEAVSISAASLEEGNSLKSNIEILKKDLDLMKQSKSILQKALLEQLSSLRTQIHVERDAREAAETELEGILQAKKKKSIEKRTSEQESLYTKI